MRNPPGEHQAPNTGRGQRPGLDRPSLFAGMDDEPEDQQRVRILSTLESSRHTARPRRSKGGRRTPKSHRRSWLQGALWGAMGVGVLTLMAGFVMVIQDQRTATAQVMPAPAIQLTTPPAAGPAVIETTQVDAPLAALSTVATAPALTPEPEHKAANQKANMGPAAKPAVMVDTHTVTPARAGKAGASKGQDEDVALLEAMFEHTGRKMPAKPSAPKN